MNKDFKKIIYIALSVFLGFLLSIIFHSVLEIYLINQSQDLSASELLGHSCYLPDYLNIGLTVFGLIAGFFLGRYWWKKVYEK